MDGALKTDGHLDTPLPLARVRPSDAGADAAIFLHTGWRTAGTWIWSRFIAAPEAMGFYEPLHEGLGRLSTEDLADRRAEGWGAESWESGHPSLRRPYFSEFADLLEPRRGGVAGYRETFSLDVFFRGAEAGGPELERYVRSLLDHAEASGKRAVLKFCRSLGRADWMTRRFPEARHIAVFTDPVRQARSARRQLLLHGNPYFIATPFAVLAANRENPRVGRVLDWMNVRLPSPGRQEARGISPDQATLDHVYGLDAESNYRGLLAFWLLGMLSAPNNLDAFIDT